MFFQAPRRRTLLEPKYRTNVRHAFTTMNNDDNYHHHHHYHHQ